MELPRNAFKHALKAGQEQIGLWSSLSSNYTVEVIQRMPTGGHTVLTWIFVVDPGGGIVVAGSLNQ